MRLLNTPDYFSQSNGLLDAVTWLGYWITSLIGWMIFLTLVTAIILHCAIGLYMRAGIGPRFPTNTEENKKKTRKDMAVAQINALPTTPEDSAIVVPVEVAHRENTPCGNNPQISLRFLNNHPELCSN